MKKNILRCNLCRITCVIFAILFLTSLQVMATDIEAQSLSKTASYTIDGVSVPALADEQLATKHKMPDTQTVKITSKTPIKSLYVLFNKPPQRWTLQYGTQSKPQGSNGFLHEVVKLDSEQTELMLTFQKGSEICDIHLFSEGELPKYVEQWQPPLDDADMLLLPTHSDDEHVFFGGILPYYAGELQKKVQVAYLNNHYGEWYRPHELLAGLWEVGVTAYPIIPDQFNDQYSDSLEHAKTIFDEDAMLNYEVELLRRFKPEVVIGHDLNGEYGHGMHMLGADLLTKAVEISADATKYPDSAALYGTFDVPKTYLHLYSENQIEIDIDRPLTHFGGKTAYEVSVAGFAHHKSQQEFFTVNKGGKYDCRKFGLYRSTVGNDLVGINLFENIIAESNAPPTSSEVSSDISSELAAPVSSTPISSEPISSSNAPKTGSDILMQLIPKVFIILGVLVIIGTMLLHNKRRKEKINKYSDAYKKAPKNR